MKSSVFLPLLRTGSLFALAATLCTTSSAVEIIAHRGASYDAPENTLASMKLGIKQNADGDELDIYLTKDGKVMLMHDKDTERTGGVKMKMDEHTSKELRKLDIGKWGKWQGAGFSEKIPYLKDALKTIPKGRKVFIEIKCGTEILPELQKVLKKSHLKNDQVTIICFDYDVIKATKQCMPQYQALWLHSKDKQTGTYPPAEVLIEKVKAANLDGLDLDSHFPIDKKFVQTVRASGLRLYTWTVDDPEVAKAEAQAGVEGITTNRPEWLRQQLGDLAPAPRPQPKRFLFFFRR